MTQREAWRKSSAEPVRSGRPAQALEPSSSLSLRLCPSNTLAGPRICDHTEETRSARRCHLLLKHLPQRKISSPPQNRRGLGQSAAAAVPPPRHLCCFPPLELQFLDAQIRMRSENEVHSPASFYLYSQNAFHWVIVAHFHWLKMFPRVNGPTKATAQKAQSSLSLSPSSRILRWNLHIN